MRGMAYISIAENANNDILIEIPAESNGTLLLSSIAAQYPGAVGLRFKSDTGAWRGCRVEVCVFFLTTHGGTLFLTLFPMGGGGLLPLSLRHIAG